jgi:hypothetical protein
MMHMSDLAVVSDANGVLDELQQLLHTSVNQATARDG